MKYTCLEARELERKAFMYCLTGIEMLADYDAVIRDCNGVGADWMADCLTQIITKLNREMEVPAAIHDRRYATGTTRQDRQEADLEFLTNVIRVIEFEYPWWHPFRYINKRRAVRYYNYLRAFGARAWEEAKKRK